MKSIYIYTFFIQLFFLSCADNNNQQISIIDLEEPADIANLFAVETIYPITEDLHQIGSNMAELNTTLILTKIVDSDKVENFALEYNKVLKLINDGIKKIRNAQVPKESLLIKKQSISFLQYLKKFHIEMNHELLTLLQNPTNEWDPDWTSTVFREANKKQEWFFLYSEQIRKYCYLNNVFIESGVSSFIDNSMPYVSECSNTSDSLYLLLSKGEKLILKSKFLYYLTETSLNSENGNILDTLNISYDEFNYISIIKNLNHSDSNQNTLVKIYDIAQPEMQICEGLQIGDSLKPPFIGLCYDSNNIYIKNSHDFSYYTIITNDGIINKVSYEYVH